MAKAEKVAGRGQKACPECGEIMGARAGECPKCHHKFTPKSGGKSAKRGGAVLDMATLEKVNELGGVPGVRKHLAAIAKLREQVAEADLALKKLGGEDGASEVVELMEAFTAAQKSK